MDDDDDEGAEKAVKRWDPVVIYRRVRCLKSRPGFGVVQCSAVRSIIRVADV